MTKPKSKPKAAVRSTSRSTSKSKTRTRLAPSSSKTAMRPDTKHARIIAMLRTPAGTTIAAIMTATDWQQHSVRGFLAGVVRKKLGLNLVSEQTDKGRVYRIKDGKASSANDRRRDAMLEKRRTGRVSTKTSIEDEIAHLRGLDLKGLRARWQSVFQRPAPAHLPRHLLFAIIAYRIQADRLGDLDHETKQVLDRTDAKSTGATMSARLVSFDQKRTELTPGTVLVREWDRHSQRVMVMPDGFAWNGQTYDSLSKVAFAITGTKWNGPRFFGLRDKKIGWTQRPIMKAPSVRPVRCAIYTRVSTEHGLDQEFNSLDAQYDAASAYIKSQAHAGWTLIKSRYDDGGYSGGSTDRPDLQRLLDDIRARKT